MRIYTFLFILIFPISLRAQTEQETKNISTLIKVWGFLKYYHPEVAKGKYDWDAEFMKRAEAVKKLNGKEETSQFYLEWIESLGEIPTCHLCPKYISTNERFDLKLNFISDSVNFNDKLISNFVFIRDNSRSGTNYYFQKAKADNLEFTNEVSYSDSLLNQSEIRLMALARCWNAYYYFFPYKYLMDLPWEAVLQKMIPVFQDANSKVKYTKAVLELLGFAQDSHAGLHQMKSLIVFGDHFPAFYFEVIQDKIIVTGYFNEEICKRDKIVKGNVITKVNGISVAHLIDENKKYFSYSNEDVLYRKMCPTLLTGFEDSVKVELITENGVSEKYIHRIGLEEYKKVAYQDMVDIGPKYKDITNDIIYINPYLISDDEIDSIMKQCLKKKGIIIDMRCYPMGNISGSISYYIIGRLSEFAIYTQPDLSQPGRFIYGRQKMFCGGKNKKSYKGKVMVLINKETQSAAEFSSMMFSASPVVQFVGSSTAGADGNVSFIPLPGDIQAIMTGLGIYYPDGRETQRIGIVPDIEVKPTIQGLREGRDEVLEKAIEVINQK